MTKPYQTSLKVLKAELMQLELEESEIKSLLEDNRAITTVGRGQYSYRLIQIRSQKECLENSIAIISKITWQSELAIHRLLGIES